MLSSHLKQSIVVFLVLTIIIFGMGYESVRLLLNPQFESCDLQSRYFGILVGFYYGIIAAVGFSIVSRIFNLWQSETAFDQQGLETQNATERESLDFSIIRGTGKLLIYIILFSFGACVLGIWQGSMIDLDYFNSFAEEAQPIPVKRPGSILLLFIPLYGLGLVSFVTIWQPQWKLKSLRTMGVAIGACVIAVVAAGVVVHKTDELARPNLKPQPRDLPEGIYLYANDVCFDLPINLYSSRLGGFPHTGLCFITQDPARANRVRKLNNLSKLKFTKLDRGYFVCDVNLDIFDRDELTNHGASAKLSNISFPFDIDHLKNYLSGRSSNDRLKPAVQLLNIPVINPLAEWDKVIAFEEKFNEMFPDGILYSPIPYTGKYAPLYNCNTLTAGIIAVLLDQGTMGDRLTDIPYSFGGQTSEEGRLGLEEMVKPDFPDRLAKQREFMKSAPPREQAFLHRLLHRDGWLFQKIKSCGNIRQK